MSVPNNPMQLLMQQQIAKMLGQGAPAGAPTGNPVGPVAPPMATPSPVDINRDVPPVNMPAPQGVNPQGIGQMIQAMQMLQNQNQARQMPAPQLTKGGQQSTPQRSLGELLFQRGGMQ